MQIPGLTVNSAAPVVLSQAIASGKLHHAYLFSGPEGAGKAAFAVETAMALLCKGKGERPCRECASCRKLLNYNHPDFRVIFPFLSEEGFEKTAKELNLKQTLSRDPDDRLTYRDLYTRYLSESAVAFVRSPLKKIRMEGDFKDKNREITIGHIRDLAEDTALPPSESLFKVYIIIEADKMNEEAANALLKTLEEPPAHVRFLLVSARSQFMLPTIRSRCQILKFHPLSDEAVRSYVTANFPDKKALADYCARFSNGSIREALELLEESNQPLMQEALDMIECIAEKDTGRALKMAEAFGGCAWPDNVRRLNFFISFSREIALGRITGATEIEQRLSGLSAKAPGGFYLKAFDKTGIAIEAIERKVQPRLVFAALFMALMEE